MSNWTDAIGRQMTSNPTTPSQISQTLGVSTNTAEAIWKTASGK